MVIAERCVLGTRMFSCNWATPVVSSRLNTVNYFNYLPRGARLYVYVIYTDPPLGSTEVGLLSDDMLLSCASCRYLFYHVSSLHF